VRKTVEEQIKALFAKYSFPPLEVIIPILEKTGKGEREMTAQTYDTSLSLANELKEILGLKDKSMKTLAKMMEVMLGFYGQSYEPIELSDSKLSFSVSECPMLHVGKHVNSSVKSKFCDLWCTSGSKAFMDSVFGQQTGTCTWNKALIKGAKKCVVTYDLVKTK
jgi:predicted house-cleaning noncanonical NTP pyrophosphatase (MazG superfamily)